MDLDSLTQLVVGGVYEDDLGVAVRACVDVITADARVPEDPAPVVAVHELADSSVNLVVRPWVEDGLEAAGCAIPFPQRDVNLHRAGV